jgi:hypothetical protein
MLLQHLDSGCHIAEELNPRPDRCANRKTLNYVLRFGNELDEHICTETCQETLTGTDLL